MLLWAAATTWFRTIDWSSDPDRGSRPAGRPRERPRRLREGEVYDRAVKLMPAPNVPLAEAMCSRLQANGIEAFSKRAQVGAVPATATNDFEPVEVWVGEHHVADARALLGPQAYA